MRKILLCTTAMAGASLLVSGAALAAEKPKLTMDGWLRFEAWHNSEDDNVAGSTSDTFNRGVDFDMDDVEIHFQGSSKADNGLEYGFYVELIEGGSTDRQGAGLDEANVFLAGGWGKLEMGANDGVENNYGLGAWSVLADKDGAWDGDNRFNAYGNAATINTDLATTSGTDDANKITYYTPSFGGFSAGISYTPDSGDFFNNGMADDSSADDLANAISAAVQYTGAFGGVGVQVSARYLTADFEANDTDTTAEKNDMRAWGLGGVVSYAGFSLGASYQDLGDSGVTKANEAFGAEAGKWYDVGLAYETGPYKVSVAYMHSEANDATTAAQQDDEVDYYTIGANYAVAPGLDLYAAYQFVDLDQAGTLSDNEASLFLLGTQVSF